VEIFILSWRILFQDGSVVLLANLPWLLAEGLSSLFQSFPLGTLECLCDVAIDFPNEE
jgi:hypothetical protein